MKLRELLEQSNEVHDFVDVGTSQCGCFACTAKRRLEACGPALATLVVTLSGELKYLTGMLADGAIPSGADMVNALDAIADVEKLKP